MALARIFYWDRSCGWSCFWNRCWWYIEKEVLSQQTIQQSRKSQKAPFPKQTLPTYTHPCTSVFRIREKSRAFLAWAFITSPQRAARIVRRRFRVDDAPNSLCNVRIWNDWRACKHNRLFCPRRRHCCTCVLIQSTLLLPFVSAIRRHQPIYGYIEFLDFELY